MEGWKRRREGRDMGGVVTEKEKIKEIMVVLTGK